jgi:hypothetical protein
MNVSYPELSSDLIAALAALDVNDLAHGSLGKQMDEGWRRS